MPDDFSHLTLYSHTPLLFTITMAEISYGCNRASSNFS